MTSLLTRLNQSEAELIYFSLPSPYRVKTVFDHFPGNLFFFYILRENPKCFPSPVSISFIPSCPSFSKLPCGVGIGKTSTIPSSNDFSKFADLKFPDTILFAILVLAEGSHQVVPSWNLISQFLMPPVLYGRVHAAVCDEATLTTTSERKPSIHSCDTEDACNSSEDSISRAFESQRSVIVVHIMRR